MRPDVLVTCDGTQIWWFDSGSEEPREDAVWAKKMSQGWDREMVRAAFKKSINIGSKGAVQGMGEHGVVLDAREKDASVEPFRYSTSVGTEDEAREAVSRIERELEGVEGLDIEVFCNAGGPNRGWWVVGLPSAGGKGHALKHVMETLGVDPARTVCCGDSGNDSTMFDYGKTGVRGVVVGNAFHDLRGFCEGQVCEEGKRVHYFANEKMARGILEGLQAMHA